MAEQKKGPQAVEGVKAADFLTDPEGAVAKLRAEIRQEIIGANILFSALLYFLIQSERGR
jgi:hypothetical protein